MSTRDVPLDGVAFFTTGLTIMGFTFFSRVTRMGPHIFGISGI